MNASRIYYISFWTQWRNVQYNPNKTVSMPIEIKELHIKALVGTVKKEDCPPLLKKEDIIKLKKEITKEVTEAVLRKLQQK